MWVKCKQGCFPLSPCHAGPVLPNYSCFLFDHNPWTLLFPVSFIVPGVYYTTEYFQEEWVPTTIVSSMGLFLCSYIPVERLASLLQPCQSGTLLEVHNGKGGNQAWGKHNNHPHICGGSETTRVMLSGWASSSFFSLQRGTERDTKAAASSPDMHGRVLCLGSCRATCPAGKSFPRKREKRRSQAPLTPETSFEVRYAFLGHVIIHRLNLAVDYWSEFYYCYREQTCRLLLGAFRGLDWCFWKTAWRSTLSDRVVSLKAHIIPIFRYLFFN